MDFTNWAAERAKLKTEIFRELREQQDRSQDLEASGVVSLNVPLFLNAATGARFIYGPFLFETSFRAAPNITFGQVLQTPGTPWAVLPEVHKWSASQGSVEGFYLEVYPLYAAPTGLQNHFIHWQAKGKASRYRSELQQEAWRYGYDRETPSHLNIVE